MICEVCDKNVETGRKNQRFCTNCFLNNKQEIKKIKLKKLTEVRQQWENILNQKN